MQPTYDEEEDSESDYEEKEYPDDDDANWNMDPDVVPCPYCHKEILEDSEQCPYCKAYISTEDAPRSRRPYWIIAGLVALGLIVLSWLFTR